MADASLTPAVSIMPAVIGLVGTTIGAILGFSGGLFTQLALERRKQEAEKKKKKAEKLEELISALYDHYMWSLNHAFSQTKSEDRRDPIPLVKASAIQHVYFQELEIHISELNAATVKWLWPKIAGVVVETPEQSYQRYNDCFNSTVNEIKGYAKREFQ